jgi:hypothetical protein
MACVTSWRSSLWARWLGWTAVFTVGLVVCGASLVWENSPLWVLGDGIGFLAILLVPAAVALAIGVRFADWWWVFGVLVAIVLLAAILVRELTGLPYERGTAQGMIGIMLWFVINLLVMLPAAAAGVWWGKRRDRRHHY